MPSKNGMILGVYQEGSNITEPKPKRSAYLEVVQGGVVVMGEGAGLFLVTRVVKRPERTLYITVEYEDPESGTIQNDMEFPPSADVLQFSVPRTQKGLRSYRDYEVKVKIRERKGARVPIDVLTQRIRSYVDTTGPEPKVFSGLQVAR